MSESKISAPTQRSLCLGTECFQADIHRKGAEVAEFTQRKLKLDTSAEPEGVASSSAIIMVRISVAAALIGIFLVSVQAQSIITASRVDKSDNQMQGPVYATIGGKETKIADGGVDAWIIQGGRNLVYSGRDGAGGFENEGMSLHIYDVRTARPRKIMSEYFIVDKVTEVTTSNKRSALLVALSDGGLGASYFALVDPARGEVFFRRWARLLSRNGDVIVLGRYREADWEKFADENVKVTPYKKEQYNLNSLLNRRVIQNKREN